MNVFGYELTLRKKSVTPTAVTPSYRWWPSVWGMVEEADTGAWQRNMVAYRDTPMLLTSSTVYACVTGIAADIAKNPIKLTQRNSDGIWEDVENPAYSPVLREPNHYQDHIEFVEQWILSKLLHGNTYVLKQRDQRGVVDSMYVLHPLCVVPHVAENGEIFYQLKRDPLNQSFNDGVMVPASEIIHDKGPGFWHGLVGVSPLFACAHAATLQGRIVDSQSTLWGNKGMPGGILYHEGPLSDEAAAELKAAWQSNYTGANVGKIAVLADGLKFEALTMTALNQQLAEQGKLTREMIAEAFHYPLWKLGGPQPPYTKPEQSEAEYHKSCLHIYIEKLEKRLDKGLSIPKGMRTELDDDNLWRLDPGSLYEILNKSDRTLTLNERRFKLGKGPIKGGDTVYLQKQDHSVEALFERDEGPDPFGSDTNNPAASPKPQLPPAEEPESSDEERSYAIDDEVTLLVAQVKKESLFVQA